MFKPLELFVGFRFARAKRKGIMSGFISMASFVGIALGVMVLIVGLSAMNGFERELNNRILGVVPSAELIPTVGVVKNTSIAVDLLNKENGIKGASPLVLIDAIISFNNKYKALQVRGVDPNFEEKVSGISKFLSKDSIQNLANDETIVIGKSIAKKLNINLGDSVDLILSKTKKEGTSSNPVSTKLKVVGFVEIGGELDNFIALVNINEARKILELSDDEATHISVRVMDNYLAREQTYAALTNVLKKYNGSFYVKTWMVKHGFLYRDIQLVRSIMYLSLIMVVAVACFNIISSLFMDVNEKRSEIAILLSMGYSRLRVLLTFIVQGSISGTFGAIFGVGLGIITSLNLTQIIKAIEHTFNIQVLNGDVYFIDFVPSEIHYEDVFLVAVLALILSVLASVIPSYISSRINPAIELSGK